MATVSHNFADPVSLVLATVSADTVLSAETAYSISDEGYTRAEMQAFARIDTWTNTVLSVGYANGDSAYMTGTGFSYMFVSSTDVYQMTYRFAGGQVSVAYTGDWGFLLDDRPSYIGLVDRAVVTVGAERISFTGVREPGILPGSYAGSMGYNGPVVGMGVVSSITYEKFGASLQLTGDFRVDTDPPYGGVYTSSITGTVTQARLVRGSDTYTVSGLSLDYATVAAATSETLLPLLLGGNDVVNGTAAHQWLHGHDGHDTINGLGGNDRLEGGTGADRLDGGEGRDTLVGGSGADTLVGGLGHDRYVLDDAFDVIVESACAVVDTLETSLSSVELAAGIEILDYRGTGPLTASGNALDNEMAGAAGDDQIAGGDGSDWLAGHAGADTLDGGSGSDLLLGGSGAGWLDGGVGNDILQGGADADRLDGGPRCRPPDPRRRWRPAAGGCRHRHAGGWRRGRHAHRRQRRRPLRLQHARWRGPGHRLRQRHR